MTLVDTLPAQLYLLAYDPVRQRLTARWQLGHVLRAAALADLQLRGLLEDRNGRPAVVTPHPQTSRLDPLLQVLLNQIAQSRPRRWAHWVGKDATSTRRAVEDGLAAAGVLRLDRHRRLGIIPATRISLRDPRARREPEASVRNTVRGSQPTSRIEPRTAALAALAAAGDLRTVLPRSAQREHKNRLTDLSSITGPTVTALRRTLEQNASAGAA